MKRKGKRQLHCDAISLRRETSLNEATDREQKVLRKNFKHVCNELAGLRESRTRSEEQLEKELKKKMRTGNKDEMNKANPFEFSAAHSAQFSIHFPPAYAGRLNTDQCQ